MSPSWTVGNVKCTFDVSQPSTFFCKKKTQLFQCHLEICTVRVCSRACLLAPVFPRYSVSVRAYVSVCMFLRKLFKYLCIIKT